MAEASLQGRIYGVLQGPVFAAAPAPGFGSINAALRWRTHARCLRLTSRPGRDQHPAADR